MGSERYRKIELIEKARITRFPTLNHLMVKLNELADISLIRLLVHLETTVS